MPPRAKADDSKVAVPEGSATLNIPGKVSRMEFTKSCVDAVLPTEGEKCGAYLAYGILPAF